SVDLYNYYYKQLGLNNPLYIQFFDYLKSLFDGSLGYSYHYESSVSELIGERIGATLQIAIPAVLISSIIALFLGTFSGYKKNSAIDSALSTSAILINSAPTFLVAMLLVITFAFSLGWFSYGGLNSIYVSGGALGYFFDRLNHLFLPIATLVIASTPSKFLMMRNITAQAVDEKYVTYAKMKGVSNYKICMRHIFKNIGAPFITTIGMSVGTVVSGSLVIENIFSINGMGKLISLSIGNLDYPSLQGCLFVTSVVIICAKILTDIACVFFDPRVRYGENYD
ncbi:MAG: ABC transporter permease, partial [Clostridia bacterium]